MNVNNLVKAWPTGSSTGKPTATLTATLAFPSTTVGATSKTMVATLKNTGTTALTIAAGGITISGSGYLSFPPTGTTCPASATSTSTLAAGASCTVTIEFQPQSAGTLTASLKVADNAANSPQSTTLTGTGSATQIWRRRLRYAHSGFNSLPQDPFDGNRERGYGGHSREEHRLGCSYAQVVLHNRRQPHLVRAGQRPAPRRWPPTPAARFSWPSNRRVGRGVEGHAERHHLRPSSTGADGCADGYWSSQGLRASWSVASLAFASSAPKAWSRRPRL